MVDKGKGIADDSSSAKRKRNGDDKSGNRNKKSPGVLQFFEDSAFEINDSSEDEDFIDDDISMYFEDVIGPDPGVKAEPKTPNIPFFPKEEEMDEEEMDKMMEERYKPGAGFVKYAEDRSRAAKKDDWTTSMAFENDPTIWKVKCMVGRERHSAFCLMQKYVDLKALGTKLQIISAFAVEHMKGFVFIEAERQCDINEACKGLCNIYPARAAPVPVSDVQHLFAVRSKSSGIYVDTWARVKNGKYKGDLAQVVSVNETKRKATVKLVPRIDLQAVSEKFGGGVTGKKSTIPAPRLITSSELEAYRPLVRERRDRDTGELYEVFDGMCLKDGYLFKKVPLDSLSFWDVRPTEAELIKFSHANKEESNDVEWLTGLFGERKKKKPSISNNKGGKGEGSSSTDLESSFEVHDLVFHGRKGFGVVIGREKDDRIKVLEEGSDRHMVVAVEARLLKKAEFDKKFTAFDQHKKIISMNDYVRILEGPLEDKKGIVKQIYKGVVFLHDENESENCGYFCAKAQICEKMESSADLCKGKGGKSDASGFDDFPSSPKSPLSPQKPFEEKEDSRNFDRDDKDGFSVGQPCRIRVGPLKGYICRVMAIRYSDITVKLDSQHKILTVKAEHLAELKGKSSGVSIGGGQDSTKPFELLGDGNAEGWMDGGGAPDSGGWNTGGQSTERSSWAPFSAPGSSVAADPSNSDANKGAGASAWETKTTQDSIPWGASTSEQKSGGWGASSSSVKNDTSDNAGWGNALLKDPVDSSNDAPSWGNAGGSNKGESKPSWNSVAAPATQTGGWGAAKKDEDSAGGWGASASQSGGSSWGKQTDQGQSDGWGTKQAADGMIKDDEASGWGKKPSVNAGDSGKWGSADNETDGGSGWGSNNKGGGSSWSKPADGGGSSWSKPADGGGSSWGNQDGGSSWSKQEGSRGGGVEMLVLSVVRLAICRENAPRGVGVVAAKEIALSVVRAAICLESAPRVVVAVAGMLVLSVVKRGICLGNAPKVVAVVVAEVATSVVRVAICPGSALKVVVGVMLVLSVVRQGICLGNAPRVVVVGVEVAEIATNAVRVVICLVNVPKVVMVEAVVEIAINVVRVATCHENVPRVAVVAVVVAEVATSAVIVDICLGNVLRVAVAVAEVAISAVRVGTCLENAPKEVVVGGIATSAVRAGTCLENAPKEVVVVGGIATSAVRVGICLENALKVVGVVVAEVVLSVERVGICLENVHRVAAVAEVEAMVVVAEVEVMVVVVGVQGVGEVRRHLMQVKRMMVNQVVGVVVGAVVFKQGEDGVIQMLLIQQEKRMTHKEANGVVVLIKLQVVGDLMEVRRLMQREVVGAAVVINQLIKRKVGAVVVVKQEAKVEDGDHLVQLIKRTMLKEVAGRSQDGNKKA
uniref:protein RNA-directed DNA methylation 3 isoform X2 n=1 Tax=Erigeron canadensis TaxID=72917 RepID=UPI001CB9D77D|nr:protein RNA-directed DNA methylation 3 isoform X2 [Erigeron canadensis]